jgi:hypothetical protein
MAKSPTEMLAVMLGNLEARTGKPLAEWMAIVEAEGPATRAERQKWLKQTYGLGQNTAMLILGKMDGSADAYEDTAGLLDGQYAGPKAALRPLYETLAAMGQALGEDVALKACRTYVTLSRRSQFAVIQATTRTRIDLGVSLRGVACNLTPAKNLGGGDAITHRIPITAAADITPTVREWLAKAYALNAKSGGSR